MLKIGLLASGAALALSAASANATTAAATGAPAPAATQPGSWGPTGWTPVSGAPAPVASAPAPVMAAPSQPMPPMAYEDHHHRHHDKQSAYHRYERGQHGPGTWNDPAYAVNDWSEWGFAQPAPGMHWARYYDDAVLVDAYGTIVDTRYGVGWDGPRPGRGYGQGYGADYPQGGYAHPGTTVTHAGNTTVTTQVYGGGPAYAAGGYGGGYAGGGYGYASGGTVFITPGTVTTTTTVTSEEMVYKKVWAKKRVWRRPIHRRIVRRPACGCEAIRGS